MTRLQGCPDGRPFFLRGAPWGRPSGAPAPTLATYRGTPEYSQFWRVENGRIEVGRAVEHRASPAKGGRCGAGALAERATTGHNGRPPNSRRGRGCRGRCSWTNHGHILVTSWSCKEWRKARRIPRVRGQETPRKKEGGRWWGCAPRKRRWGVGCGGVCRSYLLAKLVGCYSHPRCFRRPSEARRKKVPQSEAETRPKRLKNPRRL